MATGIQDSGNKMVKRCVILDDETAQAENQVEVSYQLPADMRTWLAGASETALIINIDAETGSATFDVEELQESRDNSAWRTVENFTDVTINSTGETRINLTQRVMAEYVKVLIGTVTLSGDHYFDCEIALECTIDPAKYGA